MASSHVDSFEMSASEISCNIPIQSRQMEFCCGAHSIEITFKIQQRCLIPEAVSRHSG